MDVPDIQYTRSGDVAVAYQVVGEGPVDVVWFRGMAGDLLSTWDQPLIVRHALGLAAFSRVLGFDKRGTGLSDRVREAATLETRMDDVRAVMDAAGSERAVLWTAHEGSRTALLFAATYPERTAGLVLLEPSVRGTGSSDYPWAPSEEEWRQRLASVREAGDNADSSPNCCASGPPAWPTTTPSRSGSSGICAEASVLVLRSRFSGR